MPVDTLPEAPVAATTPDPPRVPKLDALTGVRGVAAWFGVLFHMRPSLGDIVPRWAMVYADKGYLAVDLFFMLSGFVLWYNYAERLADGGWLAARSFWWRRFARIWPLHGFILALFVAFALTVLLKGHDASIYPFGELPLHILLLQNWGFTHQLAWNDPAWSISTEQAAYILFPLLAGLRMGHRLPTGVLFGLAAALIVLLHAIYAAHGVHTLGVHVPQLGLSRCLIEFTLGNLLCIFWQRSNHRHFAPNLGGLACALILLCGYDAGWAETAFVPAAFFTGLLGLAVERGVIVRFFASSPLRYLGEISYSTYLSHYLLFVLFKIAFVKNGTAQIGWFGVCGFLALVFAASVLLYHGVEKPAQRWLNAHAPGRRKPVLAPA
jgi:peptidoglycan/LPS O-acetylase OafA/YrhL